MDYSKEFAAEQAYLEKTQDFITRSLSQEEAILSEEKDKIIDARKDMWENVSFKGGFNNVVEANQALEAIQVRAASYDAAHQRAQKYLRARQNPYFARVDFAEGSWPAEPIYIGLSTLMDEDSYETFVYDWRAPISSIFYQFETGPVHYQAPSGQISGTMTLKRQFDIRDGKLNYFFDSDVNIQDEMLRAALSQNASPTMRSIVETIQRQQDSIIRDTQSELLIVQGVAGSGKTSVALHRVAFLMYQGVAGKLAAHNILILSPNNLFGSYIANVLPELGEQNVRSLTFEDLYHRLCGDGLVLSPRSALLEEMVTAPQPRREFLHRLQDFQASGVFTAILDRWLGYVARRLIPFEDLWYNGRILMTRQEMREFLLSSNRSLPIQTALSLLEKRIWELVARERKERRLPRLRAFVRPMLEHQYDYEKFGRLLSIKECGRLKRQVRAYTTVQPLALYRLLLETPGMMQRLGKGLALPEELEDFGREMLAALPSPGDGKTLCYRDAMPLLYLHARLNGCSSYNDIRQVVVDEAQDYDAIHYHILRQLFPRARYTVMGDINQTIEKTAGMDSYEALPQILNKQSCCTITLDKGFRCSAEINSFAQRFLAQDIPMEIFDRHEEPPVLQGCDSPEAQVQAILDAVERCRQAGLASIGILCKSQQRCRELGKLLQGKLDFTLLDTSRRDGFAGVMLMPIYMAKGLEFDGAILCDASAESYNTPHDKRLLYIACTRALHRLTILWTGEPSAFLAEPAPAAPAAEKAPRRGRKPKNQQK